MGNGSVCMLMMVIYNLCFCSYGGPVVVKKMVVCAIFKIAVVCDEISSTVRTDNNLLFG